MRYLFVSQYSLANKNHQLDNLIYSQTVPSKELGTTASGCPTRVLFVARPKSTDRNIIFSPQKCLVRSTARPSAHPPIRTPVICAHRLVSHGTCSPHVRPVPHTHTRTCPTQSSPLDSAGNSKLTHSQHTVTQSSPRMAAAASDPEMVPVLIGLNT